MYRYFECLRNRMPNTDFSVPYREHDIGRPSRQLGYRFITIIAKYRMTMKRLQPKGIESCNS